MARIEPNVFAKLKDGTTVSLHVPDAWAFLEKLDQKYLKVRDAERDARWARMTSSDEWKATHQRSGK